MAITKKSELFKLMYLTSRDARKSQGKEFQSIMKEHFVEHPEEKEYFDKFHYALEIFSDTSTKAQLIILTETLSNILNIESDINLYDSESLNNLITNIHS